MVRLSLFCQKKGKRKKKKKKTKVIVINVTEWDDTGGVEWRSKEERKKVGQEKWKGRRRERMNGLSRLRFLDNGGKFPNHPLYLT